jgi:membrane protease YdiL (CAAX protease family)
MTGLPDTEWPEADRKPEAELALEPAAQHALNEIHASVDEGPIPAGDPAELIAPDPAITPPVGSFLESYAGRPLPPPIRFPNFLDVFLLAILLLFCWICSIALFGAALHFKLGGIATTQQAVNDIRYMLGSQVMWYLLSLGGCLILYPAIWHKGFFDALEWHAAAAFRKRWRLFSAAFVCFVLALVDGLLLPGPTDTPIDQVFRMPGAAWLLFAFGVTMAPFFEEMAFRGFLLPAFCTAVDWAAEHAMHLPTPEPDLEGNTRWSIGAMAVGSLLTSIPFALMHAYQTGWSLGPFLLLICVSLVLCWVRLSTRSLAASTLVHSSYNLLLFSLMLAGTGGFKHLDKM